MKKIIYISISNGNISTISYNNNDDFNISVSYGQGVGITWGNDYTSTQISADSDKISLMYEITDNNGQTEYTEHHINTINTALTAILFYKVGYAALPTIESIVEFLKLARQKAIEIIDNIASGYLSSYVS